MLWGLKWVAGFGSPNPNMLRSSYMWDGTTLWSSEGEGVKMLGPHTTPHMLGSPISCTGTYMTCWRLNNCCKVKGYYGMCCKVVQLDGMVFFLICRPIHFDMMGLVGRCVRGSLNKFFFLDLKNIIWSAFETLIFSPRQVGRTNRWSLRQVGLKIQVNQTNQSVNFKKNQFILEKNWFFKI